MMTIRSIQADIGGVAVGYGGKLTQYWMGSLEQVNEALFKLPARQREILCARLRLPGVGRTVSLLELGRFRDPMPYRELGPKYGITHARAHQIVGEASLNLLAELRANS